MKLTYHGKDLCAVDGTRTPAEAHFETVVIGAGPAGAAAAIEAAEAGRRVLLVDENPVSGGQMGNDVPLFFGGRMTTATQNAGRMVEQIFASMPVLEKAMEAGVEVLLGTAAIGVFRNTAGVATLPQAVVALADADRSWLVAFDELVLATGARDLAVGFPGWNQPGVMGSGALTMLLTRYAAFAGRRLVIAGSTTHALETAQLALAHGADVAAVIEVRDLPQGNAALAEALGAAGVAIHCNAHIACAEGGVDGVTAAVLSNGETLACDTIVLAIGQVPSIELVDAMHGPRQFAPTRGGFIPGGEPQIRAVGLAAGLPGADKGDSGFDHIAYRMDWARALLGAADEATIICQCEDVTLGDLLGVQPPHYLPRGPAMAARSLNTLLKDGPLNQDQIKRLTRVGMGVCQGRRCRDQAAMLLAIASGQPLASIPLASHRAPVRPVAMRVLADMAETPAMAAAWDVWFGIPQQWVAYRDIGTPHEEVHRAALYPRMYQ